jgi:hypothetical protein
LVFGGTISFLGGFIVLMGFFLRRGGTGKPPGMLGLIAIAITPLLKF